MDPRDLVIALSAAHRLERDALYRLTARLDAWSTAEPGAELAARLGVRPVQLRRAAEIRAQAPALAARERHRAEREGARLVTLLDPDYPARLRDLSSPPPVLALRGTLPEGRAVAVVGARKMDAYGHEATELFTSRLAKAGVAIISGFARGVDAVAHRSALLAGGETVAVLGCGLDVDYPRGHRDLRRDIGGGDGRPSRGALVSEFPFASPPRPWHFPVRNRIIAALAEIVLVIQGKLRSGSMSTAHHALELGRDVFAVPGRIFDEMSMGTNALLADGALMACCPEDLLEALGLIPQAPRQTELFSTLSAEPATQPAPPPMPPPEGAAGELWAAMPTGRPQTVEDLAERIETSVDRVLALLLELELSDRVRREAGPVYVRRE